MKKSIMIMMTCILLLGVNVFAAGDLMVNGNLGIGTSPSTVNKAIIIGTNTRGLSLNATSTTNNAGGYMKGAVYSVTLDGSTSTDSLVGQQAVLNMMSDVSGAIPGGSAASYTFQVGTPDTSGTTTVTKVVGLEYLLNRHYNNQRTYNVTDSYGFLSAIQDGGSTGTAINVTNHYHQYLDDAGLLSKVNITNLYGMYIEKMTGGTYNYGLVLNGDGSGADIVFGNSGGSRPRIYSTGGVLYADDAFGSHTQISPHDPETGEWIYYSKNVKTGRTVRVDMERLVKAIEKLTGETFMVETLVADQ